MKYFKIFAFGLVCAYVVFFPASAASAARESFSYVVGLLDEMVTEFSSPPKAGCPSGHVCAYNTADPATGDRCKWDAPDASWLLPEANCSWVEDDGVRLLVNRSDHTVVFYYDEAYYRECETLGPQDVKKFPSALPIRSHQWQERQVRPVG